MCADLDNCFQSSATKYGRCSNDHLPSEKKNETKLLELNRLMFIQHTKVDAHRTQ